MTYQVFVVEDEPGIREMEELHLRRAGYEVEAFETGKEFLKRFAEKRPDLVVLDIMLPDTDGVELLKVIRRDPRCHEIPVIMATAKREDADVIRGLKEGADDYLQKPFNYQVLLARVEALIRRSKGMNADSLEYKGICVEYGSRRAMIHGETLDLSTREYELLAYFMEHACVALSRDQLMNAIWGGDFSGESRTLDMHVNRLRKKLAGSEATIRTVWGIGYCFE